MKPTALPVILALAAGLGLAGPAMADAAKAKDPAFGDWVLRCAKNSGAEHCALHQKIMARDTKLPVAAFVIARNKDSKQLRLAVILPLGLDIPAGVSGAAAGKAIAFTIQTCVRRGCIASAEVDEALLESLRGSGFSATFKMRSVAEPVTIPVSGKGLDEGLKALDGK